MRVQAISNYAFQGKFRVHALSLSYPKGDRIITEARYKVYDNPKAESIHNKLLQTKNKYERELLEAEMGCYEIETEVTSTPKMLEEVRRAFFKGEK